MKKTLKVFIKILSGFLISYAFLYLVFRKIDIKEVFYYIKSANVFWIIIFIFISFFIYFLKALRFVFLNMDIKEKNIKTVFVFMKNLLIGFMLNNFLPFRTGDIFRSIFLSKIYNINKSHVIGATFLERLFDIFSIFSFFMGFFLITHIDIPVGLKNFNKIGLYFVGVIFFLFIYFGKYKVILFRKLNFFLNIKFFKKIIFKFNSLLNGFSVINKISEFIKLYIFSLFIWFLEGISYFFIGKAVNLEIGILKFIFVMAVVCFFSMIPSGPFFLGTFEGGAMFALERFLIDKEKGMAFAIILHFLQIILVGSLGLLFLLKSKNKILDLFYRKKSV